MECTINSTDERRIKSMVILVGGVGYAGKTYMAQKLLEKYQYPYLSIDHLKMGLYRADIGCGFTPYDSAEFIGKKIWAILKGIIMTNIENDQNLIIEGIYLLPEKILELDEEYRKNIISFYICFSERYVRNYFESKILYHRSVIESRDDNSYTVEDYVIDNAATKMRCEKSNAKYFEIREDYTKEIESVYNWIDYEMNNRLFYKKS